MINGKFCEDCVHCISTDDPFWFECNKNSYPVPLGRPADACFLARRDKTYKSYEYTSYVKVQDVVNLINKKGTITVDDIMSLPNTTYVVHKEAFLRQKNRARKYRKQRNQYRSLYINGVQFIKQQLKEIERENENG